MALVECQTAEEVRANALAVHRRMRSYFPVAKPEPKKVVPIQVIIEKVLETAPVTLPDPLSCVPRAIRSVQAAVATFYGVPVESMCSDRRQRHIVRPRQTAMYLCREVLHKTFPEIARRFDRDHSTVIHACETVALRLKTDPKFAAEVEQLKRALSA